RLFGPLGRARRVTSASAPDGAATGSRSQRAGPKRGSRPLATNLRYRSPVAADTIVSRLFEQAKQRPGSPAYYVRQGGSWRPTSWRDYAAEVEQAARALISLGFASGNNVSVLGFNRPEWAVTVLAAMAAGGAAAG